MYQVFTLDLANAHADDVEIVPAGKRIAELFVLDMPAGAVFQLKVGNNSDLIGISRPFSMEPQGDQEANNGLYWRNAVGQAGLTVQIVVVYGPNQLNAVLT